MRHLITILVALCLALTSSIALADDDEDKEAREQTIDFTEELDVDGERNEADLYRKEVKRRADFDRLHEVEKKSFMDSSGGSDESSDSDKEDDEESKDDK